MLSLLNHPGAHVGIFFKDVANSIIQSNLPFFKGPLENTLLRPHHQKMPSLGRTGLFLYFKQKHTETYFFPFPPFSCCCEAQSQNCDSLLVQDLTGCTWVYLIP